MRELTKEELLKYRDGHFMTVGDLKKFIEKHNLSDDTLVVAQRVEDSYYEKGNWGVYLKEGEHYYYAIERNKKIDGEYNDKEQYPDLDISKLKKFNEEELKNFKEQYHPVWSPVRYNDDKDILFLDLHY